MDRMQLWGPGLLTTVNWMETLRINAHWKWFHHRSSDNAGEMVSVLP